ncbi:MAG: hypothetical protein HYU84_07970 [Chloroflexi bacterium]|nr:hypothetical protein [Chloroflexota bacterium]MBI3167311.1 hypothetical protein [Chloroflexota bacterium]
MLRKTLSTFGLLVLMVLLTGVLTAAAPPPSTPNVTFTLISGLPATMNVGDTATVVVQVTSDQEFNFAQMLPTFYFPGRGVVAVQGGDHAGSGTSATLEITFTAKDSTADLGGAIPVSVVAGARYKGGYTASQQFDFMVTVP